MRLQTKRRYASAVSRRSSGRQLVVDGTLVVVKLAQELASWATAAGAVIAAIGLLLTARQLKIQNRQHRLELGGLYINRFWSVDDELTMADPASEPERYKRLHIRYLKVCEDEFDAARLGGSIHSSGLYGIPSTLGPRYALSLNPLFATMATLLICALSKCASLRPLRSNPMMRRHARL